MLVAALWLIQDLSVILVDLNYQLYTAWDAWEESNLAISLSSCSVDMTMRDFLKYYLAWEGLASAGSAVPLADAPGMYKKAQ